METKTEKLPKTTKKQKFVGIREFIDAETGEIVPMQVNNIEERDFNFHKFWLKNFIEGVDGITNKKMKLAFWIIDNLNSENQLLYTFQQMAEKTGLSYDTVIKTMRELQKGDPPFLKKLHAGLYQVNPDIIYKGNHRNRMGIIYQFNSVPSKEALQKMKELDEQFEKMERKESETTNTTVTDTKITGTMFTTTETEVTDSTVTNATAVEEIPAEVVTATAPRPGRAGRKKPDNWAEVREKIIAGEITREKYCRENRMSTNTLKKWLAE